MLKKYFTNTIVLLVLSATTYSQGFEAMIHSAFEKNKQILSKDFELKTAEAALAEAKSAYQPTITFNTTYSLAAGGRSIPFPIGDLLNPAYAALNQLTNSQSFPTLENQEVQLLPNNFYDARVRIQQAVYYPEIKINQSIKEKQKDIKSLDIIIFKRKLANDIMQTYFQYQQLISYKDILNQSKTTLQEALRVSNSLIKNGMAIPSAALRLESEIAGVDEKNIELDNNIEQTQRYLNFLLGNTNGLQEIPKINVGELPTPAIANNSNVREEEKQLDQLVGINQKLITLEKTYRKPRIGLQLDLGSQDFDFKFQPYALFGASIDLNLYNGKNHKYKLVQATTNLQAHAIELNYVTDQLSLQKEISMNNVNSALASCATYAKRIEFSEKLLHETILKYKNGNVNYLEFIDANQQLYSAKEKYNLSRYNAWMKWADYMYATASFPIQ